MDAEFLGVLSILQSQQFSDSDRDGDTAARSSMSQ